MIRGPWVTLNAFNMSDLKTVRSPSSAGIIFKTLEQGYLLTYTVCGINIGTGTKIRIA